MGTSHWEVPLNLEKGASLCAATWNDRYFPYSIWGKALSHAILVTWISQLGGKYQCMTLKHNSTKQFISVHNHHWPDRHTSQYIKLNRMYKEGKSKSMLLSIFQALVFTLTSFMSPSSYWLAVRTRTSWSMYTTIAPKIKKKWTRTQKARAVTPTEAWKGQGHCKL